MQSRQREDLRIDTDAIRSQHSLVDFLESHLGVKARGQGQYVTFSACPACGASKDPMSTRISVRNDSTYKCFSCPDRGDVIHAAELLWGLPSFLEAAKALAGDRGEHHKSTVPKRDRAKEEADAKAKTELMRTVFSKLQLACQEFHNEPVVMQYLTGTGEGERCLPIGVIREAQRRGMVGFLPSNASAAKKVLMQAIGKDQLQESGLWKPDKQLPGIAYRPLVFFLPGMSSAEFRVVGQVKDGWNKSVRYGSLEYPYWWEGTDPQALVVEGVIDMLSAIAMGWRGHVMGIPGCNSVRQEWFVAAADRYEVKRWVIALDNDVNTESGRNPGQEWAARVSEMMTDVKLPNCIHAPEAGDLNDIVRARAKKGLALTVKGRAK